MDPFVQQFWARPPARDARQQSVRRPSVYSGYPGFYNGGYGYGYDDNYGYGYGYDDAYGSGYGDGFRVIRRPAPKTTAATTAKTGARSSRPNVYFSRPRPEPEVRAATRRMGSSAETPSSEAETPVFVMDRFGNLHPYASASARGGRCRSRRVIDADNLIKLLIGGDGDSVREQASGGDDAVNGTEDAADGDTLTRQGLAEILSRLAGEPEPEPVPVPEAEEEEEQEEEEEEEEEEEMEVESAPGRVGAGVAADSTDVPSLNVHRVASDPENGAHSNVHSGSLVEDVKVSAPQLKRKNLPFSPPLNVYEFKTNFIVVLSIPGGRKEFVEINFRPTSNELVITGEVPNQYLGDDEEANGFVLKVSEQRFGQFERIVKLPAYPGVDDTKIRAKFLNGLLEIKIPKLDEANVKSVQRKIILEDVPDEELERESEKYV